MSAADIIAKYKRMEEEAPPQEQGVSSNPIIAKYQQQQNAPMAQVMGAEPQYATGKGVDSQGNKYQPFGAEASYENENPLALTLAGFGKGGANVYKNFANMLGADSAPSIVGDDGGFDLHMTDTSDEGLAAAEKDWQGITDTTPGAIGEFGGEMAALSIPGIGLMGRAAKLPTAMRVLTSMGEGAVGGAILSDPNQRVAGAFMGGGAGGALTAGMAGFSRLAKDGLARMKKPATEAIEYVKNMTGKDTKLPLSIGADPSAGAISANAAALSDVMIHMPSAKGAVDSQIIKLGDDLFEADLRKALSFNKGVADKAVKVFKETGDMQQAIESTMMRNGRLPPGIEVLDHAARMAPEGRYTGDQLLKATKDFAGEGKISNTPFYKEATSRRKLLPSGDRTPAGKSTVPGRDLARGIGDAKGDMFEQLLGGAGRFVPGLSKAISTPGFQNFVMGNTFWQRKLQRAVASPDGQEWRKVVSAIRRAMAAQAGPNIELQEATESMLPLTTRGN